MNTMRASADTKSPRIGFFWFVPDGTRHRFLSKSSPMTYVPTIGGFKTHPIGHVDLWPELVRTHPSLKGFGYEYYPRGRVNWREDDNTFLLMADKAILDSDLKEVVLSRWNLRDCRIESGRDSHYRVNRLATE